MSTYTMRDIGDPESIERIDANYFTDILCNYHQKDDIEVLSFEAEQMKPGFLTGFAGGLIRYTLTCHSQDEGKYNTSLVLKAGTSSDKILDAAFRFLNQFGYQRLIETGQKALSQWFGKGPTINEILTVRDLFCLFPISTPMIFHTVLDEASERLWIFMQDLADHSLIEHPSSDWTPVHEEAVVRKIAHLHAEFWNATEKLPDWLQRSSSQNVADMIPFFQESLIAFRDRYGDQIESQHIALIERVLEQVEPIFSFLSGCDQTLVHSDFHRGNICFNPETQEPIIFDWGDTRIDVPQTDLGNFISKYHTGNDLEYANTLIDLYLNTLSDLRAVQIDRGLFMHIFHVQMLRRLIRRMSMSLFSKEPTVKDHLAWIEPVVDDVLSAL